MGQPFATLAAAGMSDQPASQKNNLLHGLDPGGHRHRPGRALWLGSAGAADQYPLLHRDNPSIKSSLKFLARPLGQREGRKLICTSSAKQAKEKEDAMAFKITYTYKKQAREIGYANDKFNSIYDAVAAAEGSI